MTNQQDTALLPVADGDWNNPNLGSLINLLLREGLHSGVWFADKLLEAAKFLTDARHRLQSLEQPKPSGAGEVERVARAMEAAEFGYSMRLTRLVDDEATYTLTYDDAPDEPLTFESVEDCHEHIAVRKRETQARAAIAALSERGAVREEMERLRIMSKQKLFEEMTEEERESGDFEGAYDWFVTESRAIYAALSSIRSGAGDEG